MKTDLADGVYAMKYGGDVFAGCGWEILYVSDGELYPPHKAIDNYSEIVLVDEWEAVETIELKLEDDD